MSRSPRHFPQFAIVLLLCGAFLTGCAPTLETRYADPRGVSINGVSVFVDMLRASKHKVDLWPGFSPTMAYRYGTIIVFVSGFDAPSPKLTKSVSSMMESGGVQKVVFVLRDSNAAIEYWRQVSEEMEEKPERKAEFQKSSKSAADVLDLSSRSEFDTSRGMWYGLKRIDRDRSETVRTIECHDGDEAEKTIDARWPLNRRLVPAENAEIIWRSGDDPLLISEEFSYGTMLVMASATPVLNGGLIDPGNRQLAIELTHILDSDAPTAVALSSTVLEESEDESLGMLRFIKVHPNGWIFGQGIFAILLFCWWKYPIFGRPRSSPNFETVRFGRHVEAVGALLRRSGDREFAWNRIRAWLGKERPVHDDDSVNPEIEPPKIS